MAGDGEGRWCSACSCSASLHLDFPLPGILEVATEQTDLMMGIRTHVRQQGTGRMDSTGMFRFPDRPLSAEKGFMKEARLLESLSC